MGSEVNGIVIVMQLVQYTVQSEAILFQRSGGNLSQSMLDFCAERRFILRLNWKSPGVVVVLVVVLVEIGVSARRLSSNGETRGFWTVAK